MAYSHPPCVGKEADEAIGWVGLWSFASVGYRTTTLKNAKILPIIGVAFRFFLLKATPLSTPTGNPGANVQKNWKKAG